MEKNSNPLQNLVREIFEDFGVDVDKTLAEAKVVVESHETYDKIHFPGGIVGYSGTDARTKWIDECNPHLKK